MTRIPPCNSAIPCENGPLSISRKYIWTIKGRSWFVWGPCGSRYGNVPFFTQDLFLRYISFRYSFRERTDRSEIQFKTFAKMFCYRVIERSTLAVTERSQIPILGRYFWDIQFSFQNRYTYFASNILRLLFHQRITNFRGAWSGPRIRAINPLSAEIPFGKTITKFEETAKVSSWEAGHMRDTPDSIDIPVVRRISLISAGEAGLTVARFVPT